MDNIVSDVILLKQGEMILKGLNRREFEMKLISNIRQRLKPFGEFHIYSMQSTVYAEPQGSCDMDAALDAAKTIFGLNSVLRAAACEKDKDAIVETAVSYLGPQLEAARSFKVESKRADKRFPMGSIELSQYVGGSLHERYPHLKPDMHNPELTVNVEVRDLASYVHGPAQQGAGGLPAGVGGRMAALLSGGIDSPVAAYMMAKRGVGIYAVHFMSPPYTSERARLKVERLCEKLTPWCGDITLFCVPLTALQEALRDNCPEELLTILLRRVMVDISQRIAKEYDVQALVTGESIGQVASQTMRAIACTDAVSEIPVFRPVIGMDKIEIIKLARMIDTFDISVEPYEDCCTIFTPKHPKTRPDISEVAAAYSRYDFEPLIQKAITNTERKIIRL